MTDTIESLRQQNAELTAEVAKLGAAIQLQHGMWVAARDECVELDQQNTELTAQRDAAMKDAERWRKARKTGVAKRGATDLIVVYNERADEAIDAAIANCKEQK